ncbi:putative palmitoyltransferase ZDHHC19 [Cricetulus griseus]|uniref:Putative palmitoyltransferase ZDHHC19 n=1 Tax=Cricetulus griseus TaxID=10029 RepID=G3GSM4_CRIGR|nr:putative palmitoyltransferase ZDHHC19 [Cricetulus griseus]
MPVVPLSWFLPSLFAAFNVMLLVFLSGLFFGFPWLAQNGEWLFPVITGPLFILTFYSLVSLNFSDPGILHRGSIHEDPMTVHVVSVNRRAFRLQWCPKCCFHRPPRTYHCPWCNICVELGSILVAVPSAGFLVPLVLLLLIQAISVSTAERSCESKCKYHQEYNPFDQGFARNWYLTMCAPLGPKYMSDVICLQRPVGTGWIHEKTQPSPPCPPEHGSPGPHGPQPQSSSTAGKGPLGSGEAAIVLQEIRRPRVSVRKSPGGAGHEAGLLGTWWRDLE